MRAFPYGWRTTGELPWRWMCAATGHNWKTEGWKMSPNTVLTHYRELECGWCNAGAVQKAYCDARTGEQPDDALPN